MRGLNDGRAKELTKQLEGEAKQDDSQAWWPSGQNYLMDYWGDTTPESTAYALKLIDRTDGASPLLPKAAVYLVSHRSQGYYWDSTEQTAMVVYGLTDYLARTQELKPNYSVEVQVNGKTVATKKFTPADALAPATSVTLNESQLAPAANQVRVIKTGDGRAYWSVRGDYYSSESKVVNVGRFSLSGARSTTSSRLCRRTAAWSITSISSMGRCGGRHPGGAHHCRRQPVEVPDDRRPDSLGDGVDCARRPV